MVDRISNYRTVRLVLFLPQRPRAGIRWAVTKIGVRSGVPTGQVVADGIMKGGNDHPSEAEIWEYLDAVVRQYVLPR